MMQHRREPLFNVPGSVLALLAVLAGIHTLRVVLPLEWDLRLLEWLAFVPIRLTALVDASGVAGRLTSWATSAGSDDVRRAEIAGYFVGQITTPSVPTLLTYALLHGGWAHLGLNGIWLLAFGTPVARRFGTGRFVLFVAVAAIVGALTHWVLFPFGAEPLIGASAAVSGCMGAALRFAFRQPDPDAAPEERPDALPLLSILRDRRALSFLVAWFVSNALFGVGSVSFGLSDQPVAWQAHVGGFLTGLLLFRWFDRRPALPPAPPDSAMDPPELAQ